MAPAFLRNTINRMSIVFGRECIENIIRLRLRLRLRLRHRSATPGL